MESERYIYFELTNKLTGVRWYTRQLPAWRPPKQVDVRRLWERELLDAEASYAYASSANPDPDQVHPLWKQTPDWTDFPEPPPRSVEHSRVTELKRVHAQLVGIRATALAWETPTWEQSDLWAFEDFKRALAGAARSVELAIQATGSWSAVWPPETEGRTPLDMPPNYKVRVSPHHPAAASFPVRGAMVALRVFVGEHDIVCEVEAPELGGVAQVPLACLEVVMA